MFMRKFFVAALMIFLLSSAAFGVVSDDKDIYLRKDVFDAKMDAFMAEMRLGFQTLREELHNEIQGVRTELHNEIQGVRTELHNEIQSIKTELKNEIQALDKKVEVLTERVNGVEKRMSDLENHLGQRMSSLETYVGWWIAFLTIIVTAVALIPMLVVPLTRKLREVLTPAITLEKMQELISKSIEENNAKLLQQLNKT